MDIAIHIHVAITRDFAMSNAKNPESWAAGLAGDSRGASAGIFMGKSMGVVQRQEMGMSYDLPGKILEKSWKSWASNPGNSWDMNGDLPKKTLWGFVLKEHPHIHRQLLV